MNYFIYILIFSLLFGCQSYACQIDQVRLNYFDTVEVELSKPMNIRDIEEKELVSIEEENVTKNVPFGRINYVWEQMKKKYMRGDCFIYFKTGKKSWKSFSGREGYLLLRGEEVISTILTKVS